MNRTHPTISCIVVALVTIATGACFVMFVGCGARSSLRTGQAGAGGEPPSADFCATASYRSGYTEVSIYLLLDASSSMADDQKWYQATAALAAFVEDPEVAGMGLGLQYFPVQSGSCDSVDFAVPAVPIAPLPDNGAAIVSSLAQHLPLGDTPTLPALRGGIEHARAVLLAEPHHAVAVALLTDGAPNACDSSLEHVVQIAAEGVSTEPQVLTYVIGLEAAYQSALAQIAEAGGTGQALMIGQEATAAELVEALRSLRQRLQECRHSLPPVAGATPVSADVSVSYELTPGVDATSLGQVAGPEQCTAQGGFFVDDPDQPTLAQLCPASCELLQGSEDSRITVTVGCGAGAAPADGGATGDGGPCNGVVSFSCVSSCGAADKHSPVCVDGAWTCPAGTVSTYSCSSCPAVPHGCCFGDGTFAMASCIAGEWVCPPGSTIFGTPGCAPPEACAALLPCASGSYCHVADFSCGLGVLLGECEPVPASCGPDEDTLVCGCDGTVYPSACHAAMAGTDITSVDPCPAPPGTFDCGPLFCRLADQICRTTTKLYEPVAQLSYVCLDQPPGCSTGCGCELCEPCPPGHSCVESCTTDSSGGPILTCLEI